MKIIQPHHKPSMKVFKYSDIKNEIEEVRTLVNHGPFIGKWRKALAISHCQVHEYPFNFFVIHSDIKEEFDGFDVFCNARITSGLDMVPFKEACMSFPFRDVINTRRFQHVEFEAEVYNPFKSLGSGLSTRTFTVHGIAAFVVQHEIDHSKGVDIYRKFKK